MTVIAKLRRSFSRIIVFLLLPVSSFADTNAPIFDNDLLCFEGGRNLKFQIREDGEKVFFKFSKEDVDSEVLKLRPTGVRDSVIMWKIEAENFEIFLIEEINIGYRFRMEFPFQWETVKPFEFSIISETIVGKCEINRY